MNITEPIEVHTPAHPTPLYLDPAETAACFWEIFQTLPAAIFSARWLEARELVLATYETGEFDAVQAANLLDVPGYFRRAGCVKAVTRVA